MKFLMSAVFLVSKAVEVPDVCKCSWCLKLLKFLMSALFLVSKVVVPGVCKCSWCLKLLKFPMSAVFLASAMFLMFKVVDVPVVCSVPCV